MRHLSRPEESVYNLLMMIRTAKMSDLPEITALEEICFPPEQACTEKKFRDRLRYYPNHFLLLFDEGRLVSMINGPVSDQRDLTDDLFDNASAHKTNGRWQMILGVDTLPACRRKGYAGILIRAMIRDARAQGREGLVLTCLQDKIHFYEKFGFVCEGISQSVHGGAVWHQMRLTF